VVDDIEVELQAIKTLQETLEPLKPQVRDRVLDYVFRVLGIATPAGPAVFALAATSTACNAVAVPVTVTAADPAYLDAAGPATIQRLRRGHHDPYAGPQRLCREGEEMAEEDVAVAVAGKTMPAARLAVT
jgi:hypothetical protein